SALGRVHPQWYVRGSLGVMSAKVIEDRMSPDRVGQPLNNTSRVSSNLFVRYTPHPWYAEVGVTHLGKRFYTAQNTPQNLPGFTRVDAMLGYTHAHWNFTFAVHNVLNTRYWRSSAMPGSPRAFTLKGTYQF
ncbi:MAG: TonB-dependent receptor, partial [Pseudomonadota bacterium]|nr:TonB-dependent receptor [Pseudomonadota bacterium]